MWVWAEQGKPGYKLGNGNLDVLEGDLDPPSPSQGAVWKLMPYWCRALGSRSLKQLGKGRRSLFAIHSCRSKGGRTWTAPDSGATIRRLFSVPSEHEDRLPCAHSTSIKPFRLRTTSIPRVSFRWSSHRRSASTSAWTSAPSASDNSDASDIGVSSDSSGRDGIYT